MLDWYNEEPVYFVLALASTLLFIIKMALTVFGGDGHGDMDAHDVSTDISTDVSGDSSGDSTEHGFIYFSVQSILSFCMGVGWMGMACKIQYDLASFISTLIAVCFGIMLMMLNVFFSFLTTKLNRSVQFDLETAIGTTGRVYLSIPEKGKAGGQIEITVSGKRSIVNAVTYDNAIPAFESIRVLSVINENTVLVSPE
ncbi:MAG: hypothetical protein HQK77_15775 [Desulfobacterales bacterium]|nr:hypothetical protein [Desulfobacterales bacterium]